MTQGDADKIFQGGLGGQLLSFFSTSDDMLWVRHSEALLHAKDLEDKNIIEWFKSDNIQGD